MHYTVIAYRWGWTNNTHYFVACTADADKACNLAREEADDRGGKYGVAVYEWADETSFVLHEYHPSTWGEDKPHHNDRIDMFHSLGHDLHGAVTTGVHWVATGEAGESAREVVEVPAWAVDKVRQREQMCRYMTALHLDIEERQRAQLPQRSADERKAWFDALSARIDTEVETLLQKAAAERELAARNHGPSSKSGPAWTPVLRGAD